MPTENSLKNLRLTPAQRAENMEKMKKTRARMLEENFKLIVERVAQLPLGLTQVEMAKRLGVSVSMVGRAIRWKRQRQITGVESNVELER